MRQVRRAGWSVALIAAIAVCGAYGDDVTITSRYDAETDTWMEINTWHMHLTTEEISIAMQEDVKFVISSDAHTPNRVGSYLKGLERAFQAGLDPVRIVNIKRK